MTSAHRCAVCPATTSLRGIVVAGTEMFLCASHTKTLGTRVPESFDELTAWVANAERNGRDRRRGERRMFPRPEGRRLNDGRRAEDDL